MKSKIKYGIIVGRFQTPYLTPGHIKLIDFVLSRHDSVVLFLGESKSVRNERNPLDFATRRQMIQETYPKLSIVQILDRPSDVTWSRELDRAIDAILPIHVSPILYGSRDSFIQYYHGKFPTYELKPEIEISASEIREKIISGPKNSREWREGAIFAAYNRPAQAYPTVDMAACFNNHVLLVRKNIDDGKWRFPGGFFDAMKDQCFLDAAKRELEEETHPDFPSNWVNLGDFRINDYRYRGKGNRDCIITTLFTCEVQSQKAQHDDDIDEVGWFEIDENLHALVIEEHRMLLNRFLIHKGKDSLSLAQKAEDEKLQKLINRPQTWTHISSSSAPWQDSPLKTDNAES